MRKWAGDVSKEVVYSIPWQTLRVQLLAKNSPKGGFDTIEGVRDNIQKLKSYVGGMSDINKVYRTLNLLNAARMGYASTNDIGSPKDKALVKFRDSLDDKYQKLKETKELSVDSPEQVRSDAKKAPLDWLFEVQRDLKARRRESDSDKKHPALDGFIKIIDKALEGKEKKTSSNLVSHLKKLAEDLNRIEVK